MSQRVIEQIANRVCEYLSETEIGEFWFILHGGEPLLLGHERMQDALETLTSVKTSGARIGVAVQTNGTLLDAGYARLFKSYDVHVSVSLDGGRAENDRHRLDHRGASTYDRVTAGMSVLQDHGLGPRNLLAVVDVQSDPEKVVRTLMETVNGEFDLLLPDSNWDEPPSRTAGDLLEYGKWLATAFDAWWESERDVPSVRFFRTLIRLMAGKTSIVDTIGGSGIGFLCVESDGTYHDVDTLKTAYEGATKLEGCVADLGLSELLGSEGY